MPRRPPKAILQHPLARTMEFTALRILQVLWGDDDDDSDVEFLEDLYACWSKLRSQRYMAPREHGSAGRHSACATHVLIYRFSDTGFRACFRMGRASFWRLIHLCEDIPEAATIFHLNGGVHAPTPRPIYQQIATALYILGASGGGAERARILLDIGYFHQAPGPSCKTIHFLAISTTTSLPWIVCFRA